MPIVSLTTDFGKDLYQVARAKLLLAGALPNALLVDVSHTITPHAIDEAAFVLDNCLDDFPSGSFHLVSVDLDLAKHKRLIVTERNEQYIIAADNGLPCLLTADREAKFYAIDIDPKQYNTFLPLKHVLVPLAVQLITEGIQQLGQPVDNIVEKTLEKPVADETALRGQIMYVTNYQNAVTNISRAFFEKERVGRNFEIEMNRYDRIDRLSEYYHEVPEGKSLAFFNDNGLLEIAINKGPAAQLLGLERGNIVSIEFFTETRKTLPQQGSLV